MQHQSKRAFRAAVNPFHQFYATLVALFGSLIAKVTCRRRKVDDDDNFRMLKGEKDMRTWLENMVAYHRFSLAEIENATGMQRTDIKAALKRFHIHPGQHEHFLENARLHVLPYPGGRHPRIDYRAGAINPQRETKFSAFLPWDPNSYIVVDAPEAIWSNLGLIYLAHQHVPTIWTRMGVTLAQFEWIRQPDGSLKMERTLPNGISFGTTVQPGTNTVHMKLWLSNGTGKPIRKLRVQNCVMLKGASEFNQQTTRNKLLAKPFAACRSSDRRHWIITAWEECHRTWTNPCCPCIHSDPKFPDCPPGSTQHLKGWLSFYQGTDIEEELARLNRVWFG